MKRIDLENVQEAGEGLRIGAGGYICRYTNVEDVPDKNYLYMEFDVVEGEFKDYFAGLMERAGFWGGRCYRSYTDKALPMFKRMCSSVSKSNGNYVFDGQQNADENTLIGKLVGIVLGEEEYVGNDGSVKIRTYVARECPVDKIKSGDYRVPELKKLENLPSAGNGNDDFMKIPEGNAQEVPFA